MAQIRIHVAAQNGLLESLGQSLHQSGFAVTPFPTAVELVQAVKKNRPDALVIALGAEEAASGPVRVLLEGMAPPTILVLPAGDAPRRAELLSAGFADVFVAPFRPGALASRLIELVGGRLRVETRRAVSLPVVVTLEGRRLEAQSADLSRDGLALKVGQRLTPHALLTLQLQPPDGRPVTLFARVVHCREQPPDAGFRYLAGLRLLAVTQDEEAAVERLLEQAAPLRAPLRPDHVVAASALPLVAAGAATPPGQRAVATPGPADAARATPAPQPPAPARRRSRPLALAAGVLVLVVAALLVAVRAGRKAPLPAGAEEVATLQGTLVVRLEDPAAAQSDSYRKALGASLRRRGAASALLVDAYRRPLLVLDAWSGSPLDCREPASVLRPPEPLVRIPAAAAPVPADSTTDSAAVPAAAPADSATER